MTQPPKKPKRILLKEKRKWPSKKLSKSECTSSSYSLLRAKFAKGCRTDADLCLVMFCLLDNINNLISNITTNKMSPSFLCRISTWSVDMVLWLLRLLVSLLWAGQQCVALCLSGFSGYTLIYIHVGPYFYLNPYDYFPYTNLNTLLHLKIVWFKLWKRIMGLCFRSVPTTWVMARPHRHTHTHTHKHPVGGTERLSPLPTTHISTDLYRVPEGLVIDLPTHTHTHWVWLQVRGGDSKSIHYSYLQHTDTRANRVLGITNVWFNCFKEVAAKLSLTCFSFNNLFKLL